MTRRESRDQTIRDRARYESEAPKVQTRVIRIQQMKGKRGSCSIAGTVTLAADLADQVLNFSEFMIAHELLHLRVPRHGRIFDALVSVYLPGWHQQELRRKMGRDAARADAGPAAVSAPR